MRIAVLSRSFMPTGGGAERYSIALVEQLAARHEIHVYAQQIDHQWPGVVYHQVSMPFKRPRWVNQLWFALCTWWACRRAYDVVHSHELTWHGDVQTVHVLPVWHNRFVAKGQVLRGWRRMARWSGTLISPRLWTYLVLERLRYAARPGRLVVAASQTLADVLQQTFALDAARLRVLTPGVDLPKPSNNLPDCATKQMARQQLDLALDQRCLLFVANDYQRKGLPTLLQALAQLPSHVMLAVVGHTGQRAQFEPEITRLGLQSRIKFLGPLKQVDLAYRAADVLVHPTLEDTFGMVVLEAMAHRLPVVVSAARYCGIAALLQHRHQAWILDTPQDSQELLAALQQLIEPTAPITKRLAQAGFEFARQHGWPQQARQQERWYQDVLRAKLGPDRD